MDLLWQKKKGPRQLVYLEIRGGNLKNIVDISVIVDSTETPRIQEVHRVIYHIICEIVEKKLSEEK